MRKLIIALNLMNHMNHFKWIQNKMKLYKEILKFYQDKKIQKQIFQKKIQDRRFQKNNPNIQLRNQNTKLKT